MTKQEIKKILNQFSSALIKKSGDDINSIIWFGSTSRGSFNSDSDIDIVIIAKNEDYNLWKDISDIAADYSLEYDCLISIMLIANERFVQMKKIGRLLAKNITKDGKVLWNRAA